MPEPFTKLELKKIAQTFPEGISSDEIVRIFKERGFRFSEATFRKYVQMGLVERCRRVGRKGKHRGSRGLYPVATLERINSIKSMISGEMTLDQLKSSYFQIRRRAEEADRILLEMLQELTRKEEGREHPEKQDALLRKELETIGKQMRRMIARLEGLETGYYPEAGEETGEGARIQPGQGA